MSIDSPCNKICLLDAATGLCVGCGRTGAEIGGWIGMHPGQRREIMAQLPERLKMMPSSGSRCLTPRRAKG
ncbi:MAG: DUF1289 domain-containing protein [Bosea sp.]|jgi:predicted Fe-S protein YdhL (DUF1289 family)|nr:DUF1289 domain-containing protein [Bosea sp. (in: a-proteobacteria)]